MIRSHAGLFRRSLVATTLLVAIALPAGAAVAARTVTVGAAANGKTLVLKKGDTLVLRLASNPTTGFGWWVVSKPKALKLLERTFVMSGKPPHPPGQGGTSVFRFSVRSGQGRLKLVYRRSWEKGTPPSHSFALSIRAN